LRQPSRNGRKLFDTHIQENRGKAAALISRVLHWKEVSHLFNSSKKRKADRRDSLRISNEGRTEDQENEGQGHGFLKGLLAIFDYPTIHVLLLLLH